MDKRRLPRSDEVRKRISDGALSAWVARKQERAQELALLYRSLLYATGEIRPGTADFEQAKRALEIALRDGKFQPVERMNLQAHLGALKAGHRVAVKVLKVV